MALGATTNLGMIPGSEGCFTFKTMADALVLRNHLIERLERADATSDPAVRRRYLTFVVIGGGLVGVELLGELTAFTDDILRFYPRLRRDELRFHLFEAGARILPEIDEKLAETATGCSGVAEPTSGPRRRSGRSSRAGCMLDNGVHRSRHDRARRGHRAESGRGADSGGARRPRPHHGRRHDAKPKPPGGVGPG